MRKFLIGAAMLCGLAASPAYASLNVFACEPEWGALSSEVGGVKVSVYTATTGAQDPHQIQARPSLIAKARTADITVCEGAELEIRRCAIAMLKLLQRESPAFFSDFEIYQAEDRREAARIVYHKV